ncbi:DUF4148 domain-containing protein [Burkholderia territorii]|uniref:DUF4148 domain-containing protein n=1 Tax=Burkholderia territorii TaxID=1503055 RepID=A0A6L3NNM1_9BURK|nr:DUF4148 domain-containing protein [Burkholderia territorii]MBM2773544.1 DUF4148 domain-containing protein [Burkholderia territorii]VWC17902.1 purine nucleoside phosphorylase [Burkholderia territorii]
MESLLKAFAIGAMLVVPVVSFAQSQPSTMTRAEVRKELVQIQKAGYKPSMARNTQYPENLQAAQARVAAMNVQNAGAGR